MPPTPSNSNSNSELYTTPQTQNLAQIALYVFKFRKILGLGQKGTVGQMTGTDSMASAMAESGRS